MLTYADVCHSDFVKEPHQLKTPTLGHINVKSVLKKTGVVANSGVTNNAGVVANSNSGVANSGVTDPLLPPLKGARSASASFAGGDFAPPVKKEKKTLTNALNEEEEELDFSLQVRALLRQYLYFCT